MSSDIAESLATEIAEGTYAPSQFDDCAKPALPVDQNPQIVRFKQFNLFVSPRLDVRAPKAPEFLILRQYDTSEPGRKPIIDKLIKPLSGSLRANLGTRPSASITIDPNCKKTYAGYDPAFQQQLKNFDLDLAKIPGAKICCE